MDERFFQENNCIETIMDEYSPTVYKLGFSQTGNQNDAAVIFQEVFLKYIKMQPAFEDKEHEKAWFIQAAIKSYKNLWYLPFKKYAKFKEDNITINDKSEEKLSEEGLVEEYLFLLPQKYRITIHLLYYENMSILQISKFLKRNESVIKMQIMRTSILLKEHIERDNFNLKEIYYNIISKIEPGNDLISRTKEMMYLELKRKTSSLAILKYRFTIISAYLVFIFLSIVVFRFQNYKGSDEENRNGETSAIIQEYSKGNNNYIKNGYEYKKGDVVNLIITFPQEYIGKEIEIVYCDYVTGKSINVYKGKVIEVLSKAFNIDEDGKADFIITDSGENNITELVDIFYVIERWEEKKENIKPVQ